MKLFKLSEVLNGVFKHKKMNTGKLSKSQSRRKRSALEDDATKAAGRSDAAAQTDPVGGSYGFGQKIEGSHRGEETSARDPHTGQNRAANQGHANKPSSSSCDTNKQGARCQQGPCDDIPTLMVPGRIVQNVYPVKYQGTVLYIPTGGFVRPHELLDKTHDISACFCVCCDTNSYQ